MKTILIEGLDLAGKTTLCKKILEKYPDKFIYRKGTYSQNNELYRETIEKSKSGKYSDEVIAWMYVAVAKHELDLIKGMKGYCDKIILQDSFFPNRTIGFHCMENREELLKAVHALIKQFESPMQTFYIYSDLSTRKERFIERQKIKKPAFGDNLVLEDENKALMRERYFRNYMVRQYGAKVLDNSNIDIDILVEEVYKTINGKNIIKEREEEK